MIARMVACQFGTPHIPLALAGQSPAVRCLQALDSLISDFYRQNWQRRET